MLYALAFGAHPDDVEVGAGGLIYKWNTNNKPTGIVDLTQGESASNGTIAERQQEAEKSRSILKSPIRINLNIPDGNIDINQENVQSVVEIIRTYKPEVVLAPYWKDRHTDHTDTHQLIMKAVFQAGLKKYVTDKPAHKVQSMFFYMLHYDFAPSVIVDVSESFEQKMHAVRVHESQFGSHKHSHETYINNGEFLRFLEARHTFYGHKIGVSYGEAYALYENFVGVDDLSVLLTKGV